MNKKIFEDNTPIMNIDGVLFKRDDLFKPFGDLINGSKLLQCIKLMYDSKNDIIKKHSSTVCSSVSANSPQSYIIARVAREFGFKCLLTYGFLSESNYVLNLCRKLGADTIKVCDIGYDKVIMSRSTEIFKNYFVVKFGINVLEHKNLVEVFEKRISNFPDRIDNLVIPCGSGVSAGCILNAIKKFNKKIKKIFVVQIAGYDRTKTIKEITDYDKYEFIQDHSHKYSELIRTEIGFYTLDKRYESKAYNWMKRNLDITKGTNLFYIIGNNNWLYDKKI